MTQPRIAVFKNNWKRHQNTVYGCNMRVAQSQGLQFYQTRSSFTTPYLREKAAVCGSLAHTSGTSCMIVDHADDTRSIALESRRTLMSTCRDCWNCRVNHSTPAHDLFTRLNRGILWWCGFLIVAALVPFIEAFRCSLPVGVLGSCLDGWTYVQASLEVGANLHKCKVKRDSRHMAIAGLKSRGCAMKLGEHPLEEEITSLWITSSHVLGCRFPYSGSRKRCRDQHAIHRCMKQMQDHRIQEQSHRLLNCKKSFEKVQRTVVWDW